MNDLFGNIDEEGMYRMALAVPLSEKIESAISMIRLYEQQALELSPDGYYVAFSGGKDSIVLERLFKMAGVKYRAWYNNVTIDPPELVQFVKRQYPEVGWNNPKSHLLRHMVNNRQGLPTRLKRWCCEIYKEQGGRGSFKAIGVRAEESARRKGIWRVITSDRRDKTPIMCPILYWSEKDVWEFIKSNDMPYCSLYDEGYSRLGCIGCPMSRKGRIRDFERWPKYEKMWKNAAGEWFDKWKPVLKRDGTERAAGLKTKEQMWEWWLSEAAIKDTDQPDCQLYLW